MGVCPSVFVARKREEGVRKQALGTKTVGCVGMQGKMNSKKQACPRTTTSLQTNKQISEGEGQRAQLADVGCDKQSPSLLQSKRTKRKRRLIKNKGKHKQARRIRTVFQ